MNVKEKTHSELVPGEGDAGPGANNLSEISEEGGEQGAELNKGSRQVLNLSVVQQAQAGFMRLLKKAQSRKPRLKLASLSREYYCCDYSFKVQMSSNTSTLFFVSGGDRMEIVSAKLASLEQVVCKLAEVGEYMQIFYYLLNVYYSNHHFITHISKDAATKQLQLQSLFEGATKKYLDLAIAALYHDSPGSKRSYHLLQCLVDFLRLVDRTSVVFTDILPIFQHSINKFDVFMRCIQPFLLSRQITRVAQPVLETISLDAISKKMSGLFAAMIQNLDLSGFQIDKLSQICLEENMMVTLATLVIKTDSYQAVLSTVQQLWERFQIAKIASD